MSSDHDGRSVRMRRLCFRRLCGSVPVCPGRLCRVRIKPRGRQYATMAALKGVFPHHTLDRLFGLAVVFGVLFLVVFDHDLTFYREIDKLSYWHSFVDFYGLLDRDFEGPMAAEAYIPFAGCCMDI